ncbi:MAG: cation-transporting P-type ATPase [Thiogranum sp.]|nr:cation-transporting P-type ATPase [Thiogranum sp.]
MSGHPQKFEQVWTTPVEKVLSQAGIQQEHGLDSSTVAKRRRQYGPNRLRESTTRPLIRIFLDQLKSVVVILLLSAAAAAALFGRTVESIAIGAAILVNTVIGFTMEWRYDRR